jgi:hypothetical protein|tara:strand:+ start:629 stop:904 length:276 start_codon:yes stop_codon:yes gene_type:complete
MISLKMDVATTTGEKVPVVITPRVQVEFERHFKFGIAKAFTDDMHMEYVYYLAWRAMTHAQKTAEAFDDWLDSVSDIEMVDDDSLPLAPTP